MADPFPAAAFPEASPTESSPRARRLPLVRRGDAFDLLDELEPNSVDLVLTSPPYWGLRTYGHDYNENILEEWKATGRAATEPPGYSWYRDHGGALGLEPYPQWYVAHLVEILSKLRRVLKPTGSLWLNIGDTYFGRWSSIRADGRQGLGESDRIRRRTPSGGWLLDKQLLLIPSRTAIALQDDGWIVRNDVIWAKPSVAPRPEADRLRLSHEHFFHVVQRPRQGRASYYYNLEAAEPDRLDVVAVGVRKGQDGHSATFPADLIRPRIESSCPPGGLVLDPFCGTGRSLVVAVESGRVAHGFELSERYAQAARANVRRAHLAVEQLVPRRDPSETSR
ncbi:site-specific DNA-methyltransferase [Blastococcus saxobsidens]|uniref:Methyltransferase n=1 Tax=Blastococcus saxobsidens TaxID=138336 RepID=A0A6L9VZP9_9ACTN|nr:site-specific DNA-methyltransferase [Blastococcus saxobsidens]